jgi:hypothetical protein
MPLMYVSKGTRKQAGMSLGSSTGDTAGETFALSKPDSLAEISKEVQHHNQEFTYKTQL